jgi:hypothetical protein
VILRQINRHLIERGDGFPIPGCGGNAQFFLEKSVVDLGPAVAIRAVDIHLAPGQNKFVAFPGWIFNVLACAFRGTADESLGWRDQLAVVQEGVALTPL